MKLQLLLVSTFAFASACQKNSKQDESDNLSRKGEAALPIQGSYVAKEIYTSTLSKPLVRTAVKFSDENIDKETTSLKVDIDEAGTGTLAGESRCRELGIMTLNIDSQFVAELIMARSGFKTGINFLARHSDVSRCENDFGPLLAQSVRKVYPAKTAKGEVLNKLSPDVPIPATGGPLPGMVKTVNGECSKLHNGKLLRISVANSNNSEPYQLNLEPLACIGFKDKDMKELRLIFVHEPTGATMIDYVKKDETK